jgi:hypothetical protein
MLVEDVAIALTLDGTDGGVAGEGIGLGLSPLGQAASKIPKAINGKRYLITLIFFVFIFVSPYSFIKMHCADVL